MAPAPSRPRQQRNNNQENNMVPTDKVTHRPSVMHSGGFTFLVCSCSSKKYGLRRDAAARKALARHLLREKWGVEPTLPLQRQRPI